jgi:hypothetical protein
MKKKFQIPTVILCVNFGDNLFPVSCEDFSFVEMTRLRGAALFLGFISNLCRVSCGDFSFVEMTRLRCTALFLGFSANLWRVSSVLFSRSLGTLRVDKTILLWNDKLLAYFSFLFFFPLSFFPHLIFIFPLSSTASK